MEPPSPELVRTLSELKLCGAAELRQAGRLVRDLARDLPTFDCVWIDALARLRCLTHFQAGRLAEPNRDQLLVAEHVLRDHLGCDSWYDQYLAKSLASGRLQCITCMDIGGLNASAILERISATISSLEHVDQRHLIAPARAEGEGDRLLVFSDPPPNRDLKELVTRRGRWKPALVRDLAAQLATGLCVLERAGLCHGDVRLETVVLSHQGHCALKLPGVLAAVHPELTIHADFSPDCVECLAPERVGVGSIARAPADQYSLGCLMWHLLAGRPPYLSADPLTKVAQHQTRNVPDVRELAPDTPELLWRIIARLTSRDPAARYANWTEVLRELGHPTFSGQRRLATFANSFERPAVTSRYWGEIAYAGKRLVRFGVVAGLIAFAVVWFPANRGVLLNIAGSLAGESSARSAVDDSTPDAAREDRNSAQSPPYPLPAPDTQGTILLADAGPWRAGTLQAQGTLIVRGAPGVVPVIIVENEPLLLRADVVRLENVVVRRSVPNIATKPLIVVASNEFEIERCALIDTSSANPLQPLVQWTADPESSGGVQQLGCHHSFLVSQGAAFEVAEPVQTIDFQNSLRLGEGPLLDFGSEAETSQMRIHLANVTLRQAGPICRMPAGPAHLQLQVDESILDFAPGRAWLEFVGVGTQAGSPAEIDVAGEGTIANGELIVGSRLSHELPVTPVDESTFLIDGLFGGEFEFRSSASLDPSDSMLSRCLPDAPRQSPTDPGFDASRLIDVSADAVRTGALE